MRGAARSLESECACANGVRFLAHVTSAHVTSKSYDVFFLGTGEEQSVVTVTSRARPHVAPLEKARARRGGDHEIVGERWEGSGARTGSRNTYAVSAVRALTAR